MSEMLLLRRAMPGRKTPQAIELSVGHRRNGNDAGMVSIWVPKSQYRLDSRGVWLTQWIIEIKEKQIAERYEARFVEIEVYDETQS